jgi:uncharacterized protein YbaR (Trm112 family)
MNDVPTTRFRRQPAGRHATDLQPGEYKPGLRDERRTAILCCPKCGHTLVLGERHYVSMDGSVGPSVVCTHEKCDYHANIVLEGW